MKRVLLTIALLLTCAAMAHACGGVGSYNVGVGFSGGYCQPVVQAYAQPAYIVAVPLAPVVQFQAVQTYAAPAPCVQAYSAPAVEQTYAAPAPCATAFAAESYGNVGVGSYGVGSYGSVGFSSGYGVGFSRFGYGAGVGFHRQAFGNAFAVSAVGGNVSVNVVGVRRTAFGARRAARKTLRLTRRLQRIAR